MPYIGRSTDGFGVRNRFLYLASASDTSVSGADANGATLTFTDGAYVDVYLNGVLLKAGTDYNTNTANTIAGLTATVANDEVTVLVYDIFTTADMVSATSGGTFSGAVTFGSTVSGLDVNGTEIILDADADTSITADTDDQIDFRIGGSDKMSLTASALNVTGNIEPTGSVRVDDGQYFQAGDSYDLQMYHDGSNSFIEDQGTGDLILKGTVVRVRSDNFVVSNAANNEDMITAAADGAVNLRHNHVSCLTTTSDGGIDIEGGDIIFSTADKGIVLGATSNTDANTLADYEEGTFTWGSNANVSFQSSSNVGKYTKIGRMVYVQFWMDISSVSGTNHFYANSMPFLNGANTTNTINGNSIGSCSLYNVNFDDTATTTMPILDSGSSTVYFYHAKDNSNWDIMINSEMINSSEVGVTLAYMTDL